MSRPSALQRAQQTRRLLASEGYAGVVSRLRTRAADLLAPPHGAELRVRREDLVRAAEIAAAGWPAPQPLPIRPGEPLEVAWVCVPPGEGAGGFTTMFRLVAYLERMGCKCVLYLHDRHGWAIEQHRETMRSWWPWMKADIRDAADGIADAHAIVASAWETAYVVLTSPARGRRFYLVQDFEPWFHAAGSEALLAEATYGFDFHGITAGRWLAEMLSSRYGMAADHFDFGCDLGEYTLRTSDTRAGVCCYARPSTPRRAFELAVSALDLFSERHPGVPIHFYGETISGVPFPATLHGVLKPAELNGLYNSCIAGLVLSATNVSLVPYEMLASGCIPVVNDAEHNRIVLDNPEVAYAPATPFDLANALSLLVQRPEAERRAAATAASSSVQGASWDDAGAAVHRTINHVVHAAAAIDG